MKKLRFFLKKYRFELLAAFSLILIFSGMMSAPSKNHSYHYSTAWICISWGAIAIGFCLMMYSMYAKEFADRMEISRTTLKELEEERLERFAESLR